MLRSFFTASLLTLACVIPAASLRADTLYSGTFDPTLPGGWMYHRTGGVVNNGSNGYFSGFANGTDGFRTGNYLFAQNQLAATVTVDHFLRTTTFTDVDPTANPSLYATWLQSGTDIGGATSYLAVEVDGSWYGSMDYTIANGEYTLDLFGDDVAWQAIDFVVNSTLTIGETPVLTSAELFALGGISGIGYYIDDLPGSNGVSGTTGAIVTMRLDNLRVTTVNSADNNWLGIGGAGGDGNWNLHDPNATNAPVYGDGHWETGNYYKWTTSTRHAYFGGANDAGNGGTVTLTSDLTGVNSVLSLNFGSKADGYLIKGDATPRLMTLSGNILIDPAATVTFGENLTVRQGGAFYLSGGGKLILDDGALLENTASFVSILGGSTLEVKTGAVLNSFDTLLIGSTVVGGIDGTATLLVSGGIVNVALTGGGSRNIILGNRTNLPGDVTVTITDGEINGSRNAGNGLVFENTGASSAYFNLEGGVVTVRRVIRNASPPTAGEVTQFNFDGGVLRVDALGGSTTTGTAPNQVIALDRDNANFVFLENDNIDYRVLEGGAILDTNGRNVLVAVNFASAALNDGGFIKRGGGILQLHGANTFNGDTVIEEGTLSIQALSNLGSTLDSEIAIHDNATLRVTASMDLSEHSVVLGDPTGGGNASIEVAASQTVSLANGMTESDAGSGTSFTKKGTGTLNLGGASDHSGKTMVEAGELILGEGAFGAVGSVTNSPWIEVAEDAVFDMSIYALVETVPYQYATSPSELRTLSGSGTFRGDSIAHNGVEIRVGGTSTGNQGMANLAAAGDLVGTLTFDGNLDLADTTLFFQLGGSEPGEYDLLDITGDFSATDQTQIEVAWTNGYTGSWNAAFDLINWGGLLDPTWGGFEADPEEALSNFVLPDLQEGWYWDTNDFLTTGVIRIAPEPGRAMLLLLALGAVVLRRRRA
jgi:autotransporter-associated beta strand protein